MSFLIGELAARLTADDKPLLGKLKGARQEGTSTARAIGKGFSDASMSIKEEMYFLQREIKWLERERKKLYDPEKIKSYTRELEELTERKKELRLQGERVGDTTSRMNELFRVGATLAASYISFRTIQSVISLANETAKLAQEIENQSKQTGLGTQVLQEYKFISEQLGGSFDSLVGTINSFSQRIPMIQSGTSRAADAMRVLSVSLYDAEGQMRSMDDLFPSIVSALQEVSNKTERNALAHSIFGERAEAIIPLLEAEASSVEVLRNRFRELGIAMDEGAIQRAIDYNQRAGEMSQRTQAIRQEVGLLAMDMVESLLPALEKTADWFLSLDEAERRATVSTASKTAALLGLAAAIVKFPITALVGGFSALVGRIYGSQQALKEFYSEMHRIAQGDFIEGDLERIPKMIERLESDIAELRRELENPLISPQQTEILNDLIKGLNLNIARLHLAKQALEAISNEEGVGKVEKDTKQTRETVGELQRKIRELQKSIEGAFDREEIQGYQMEIEELEKQIDRLLNGFVEINRAAMFTVGMEAPIDQIIDPFVLDQAEKDLKALMTSIEDIPMFMEIGGDDIFPPGSLGEAQERLKELQKRLQFATDPVEREGLKKEIEKLNDEIKKFGPEAERSTRKADMAMGALGNSIGSVVGHLIAGKKEALSFGRILASVVPALINVATGGQGGFAASLASGLFGGLFHGGGVVPGHGEKYIKVKGGEGVFTQSQMKAMGVMSSAAPQISPVALKSAFSAALQEHTQRLGPEEVYVMAQKGRRAF